MEFVAGPRRRLNNGTSQLTLIYRPHLSSPHIPDRARRFEIASRAPYDLRVSNAINGDREIISEGKFKTIRQDIVIAPCWAGKPVLTRPRCPTVARAAREYIPQRILPRVHPRNAHVASNPGGDRRKTMLHLFPRRRNVRLRRPARPA